MFRAGWFGGLAKFLAEFFCEAQKVKLYPLEHRRRSAKNVLRNAKVFLSQAVDHKSREF